MCLKHCLFDSTGWPEIHFSLYLVPNTWEANTRTQETAKAAGGGDGHDPQVTSLSGHA